WTSAPKRRHFVSMGEKPRLFLLAAVVTTVTVASLTLRVDAGQSPATAGKAPTVAVKTGPAPKTPGGEPDLQGMWSRAAGVPLQRPPKYGNREFFADAERAE